MLNNSVGGNSRYEGIESILKRFHLRVQDLIEIKEHVLAAIVIRYLCDVILGRLLSFLLREEEEALLSAIYESMATMDSSKGKDFTSHA